MSLESALYSYLGGISAVSALVGARIYPSQAPQGAALPYVAHARVSTRRFPHIGGPSGMVRARQQLDVYAATLDAAQSVVDALRDNLDGLRGAQMGDEALDVVSVDLDDERVTFSRPQDGGDPGVFRVSLDFIILFGETATSV